jgi:hypothetical protein
LETQFPNPPGTGQPPDNPAAQRDSSKDYNYLNITMQPSSCLDRRIPLEVGQYTFIMQASEQCVVNLQPHFYALVERVSTAPEGYIWTSGMELKIDRHWRYATPNGVLLPTQRFLFPPGSPLTGRPFPAPDAYCGAVIARTETADWTFLGTNHRRFLERRTVHFIGGTDDGVLPRFTSSAAPSTDSSSSARSDFLCHHPATRVPCPH